MEKDWWNFNYHIPIKPSYDILLTSDHFFGHIQQFGYTFPKFDQLEKPSEITQLLDVEPLKI